MSGIDQELNAVRARADQLGIAYTRLVRSHLKNKRFSITLPDDTTIHFGHPSMQNFLVHKDPERRERFRKRWQGLPHLINDPRKSGYYSYRLLW